VVVPFHREEVHLMPSIPLEMEVDHKMVVQVVAHISVNLFEILEVDQRVEFVKEHHLQEVVHMNLEDIDCMTFKVLILQKFF